MIGKTIFSIMVFFKIIDPVQAEICFFDFCVGKREVKIEVKREETYAEKIFSFFRYFVEYISSYQQELLFIRVSLILSTIGIVTIIVLLSKLIRGRHRTQNNARSGQDSTTSNQGSLATEVNISNTLRVESGQQAYLRGDNLATMKKPNEFNEKIDVETWLVQIEIYLEKCVDRREWFDVTLSHINVNCLKDLTIAELRYKQNNYQLL